MSRLGFVGCHGGGAGDLLRGVEDVRWVAAGLMVWRGGEVVGAPPQPRVDGRWRQGWWGGAGMERRTCRAGTSGAVDGMGTNDTRAKRKKGSHDPLTRDGSHVWGTHS
jgi:hypothetical protein